jgi:phosphopantetheinyl transferase
MLVRDAIWHWPDCPELPPRGGFVLICLRTGLSRIQARGPVRAALRQVLAAWSRLSPVEFPLKETPRGPACEGLLHGELLDMSLAYEEGEAWIALRRGGLIGVDVMRLKPVPEAEAVARDFFTPAGQAALREATDPVREFGLAWTRLEACCKCLKCGLPGWSEVTASLAHQCATQSLILQQTLALSVATAPQDLLCRRNA